MRKLGRTGNAGLWCLAAFLGMGCARVGTETGTPTTHDLPEIRFDGPSVRTVSVRELQAGLEIPVEIVVPAATATWRAAPMDGAGCQRPDKNGLILFPVVRQGEEIIYCPACDVGYCSHTDATKAAAPRAGKFHYVFRWRGELGVGPSHYARKGDLTGEPRAVEPGEYRVTVTTAFVSPISRIASSPRTSQTSLTIHVVR